MNEILKSENMPKKSSFLCSCYILRAIGAGRCRERRYADHIFIPSCSAPLLLGGWPPLSIDIACPPGPQQQTAACCCRRDRQTDTVPNIDVKNVQVKIRNVKNVKNVTKI